LQNNALNPRYYINVRWQQTVNAINDPQSETMTLDPGIKTQIFCAQGDGSTISLLGSLTATWGGPAPASLMIEEQSTGSCPLDDPYSSWDPYWVSPEPHIGRIVKVMLKKPDTTSLHRLRIAVNRGTVSNPQYHAVAQLVCTRVPIDIDFPWPGGTLYFEFQWCSPNGWQPYGMTYPGSVDGLVGATVEEGAVVPGVRADGSVAMTIKAQPPRNAPPGLSEATFSW
jgi:hypothetical protein